jgi:two-component system sensor histidine kinase KdpD
LPRRRDTAMLIHAPRQTFVRVGVGSIGVALLTFVCFELKIDLASAIPLYMFPLISVSMTGDFIASAIIAVLAAACLDLFFTQPLFSFYVNNLHNLIALITFVVTALVITRLVSWQQKDAVSAQLGKNRLDRLYKVSQQLLALESDEVMSEKFLRPFRQSFGVTAICAFDADTAELHMVGVSQRDLAAKTREAYISGRDLNDLKSRISVRCFRLGGGERMTGAIGFEGLQGPDETSGSLAALAAVLVEKTKAFRKATSAAAAAQAEVYRSAVLDALAHEFKTPLATILAAAGGIREAGALRPEQEEMAETIESEAVRLDSLASRLLRTARLDREQIRPRMDLINLGSLTTQISDQYAQRSPDRQILLENVETKAEVLADPQLLRIALSQLVENACKYSAPSSVVTIATEQQGDFISIKVSNTGSSIPHSERTKIFERFYRGADASRTTAGSGLGLYVARKIAIAHGGSLDLEIQDKPAGRITFLLKIPVAREAVNHAIAAK